MAHTPTPCPRHPAFDDDYCPGCGTATVIPQVAVGTYTGPCAYGCGAQVTSASRPPKGGLGCGSGDCLARHNEAANAARRAPRPRRPGRVAVVSGDWGMAMLLTNGGLPVGPQDDPAA